MTVRIVEGKRPPSLEYAPNFLSQVQAAAALGVSVHQLVRMEKELDDFPKRVLLPFSKQTKFRRDDLLDWYTANRQGAA